MLFNSYNFIFYFLPIVLIGFFSISKYSNLCGALFLAISSLLFYSYWNPLYTILLLLSISVNYAFGYFISRRIAVNKCKEARLIVFIAVISNLLLLGYFKYSDFFISFSNELIGTHFTLLNIILPLGISFFTFTQIAFIVDAYRGEAKEYSFAHYLLFVTYFPHLIAGPVLHHKPMMYQFKNPDIYKPNIAKIGSGVTLFTLGLSKKVLIADTFASLVDPAFATSAKNIAPAFIDAWISTLSYTFQIYFDFSGYSDMAVGLSLMFGVVLPINFNSPYKSTNVINFWRRWHITLSNFLRDYLYIPLGGNRNGVYKRHLNIFITMLLGGFWHGANWTFIIWGSLHGAYLVINHSWEMVKKRFGLSGSSNYAKLASVPSLILTFFCIVISWVFFRAETVKAALLMLNSMVRVDLHSITQSHKDSFKLLTIGLGIVWLMPNTGKIVNHISKYIDRKIGIAYSIIIGALLALCVLNIGNDSAFLYFQF